MTLYRQWHAKACLITYANNKGADQTVHKCLCCLQLVLYIATFYIILIYIFFVFEISGPSSRLAKWYGH